jgi:hypothetical protein
MFQINFYVPKSHAESVKLAMFGAGAGKIGNYECCSFEVAGVGQFKPMTGADPFVGNIGCLELVDEVKIEMVCAKALIREAVRALKGAHPYEAPAYHVLDCLDF